MNKIILTILTILILFPASVFADTVGFFSKIEGRVDILKQGAATAVSINVNDPVSIGDIVRTKSDGKAEITFKDDTTVRVASESRLKIDEYAFNPDNTRKRGVLDLFRGKIRAVVSKSKAIIPIGSTTSSFDVNTPTAIAGVRGSALFVFHDRGITGVIFTEGQGFVVNPNVPERVVNISAGQVTFVTKPDAPPLAPRPATGIELAVHTKDTTPQEKPKEKKEEGDKQKEEKKTVEAKKEDKEGKKDEGKKDEGNGEKPTKESPKTVEASAKADVKEASPVVDIIPAASDLLPTNGGTAFGYTAPQTILAAIAEIVTPAETITDGTLDTSNILPFTEVFEETLYVEVATLPETLTNITLTDTSSLPPPPTPTAFIGLMYPDNSSYPSYCLYNCGNFASLPWDTTYTNELTQDGFMDGGFAGIGDIWAGPQTFYAAGTYSNPNNRPLWFSISEAVVADGSAFYGYTSGINLYNYLEGGLIAIYIKPDGTAGYIRSNDMLGFFDPANSIWAAQGTLTSYQMGSTYVPPVYLYDYSPYLEYRDGYGNIGGDIIGNFGTESANLIDQNWGIWIGYGGGSFSSLPAQNWQAKVGGETRIGDWYDIGAFDGYWLGNITGTEWTGGKLKGTVHGKYLSYHELGQFDGKVLGAYDGYGNWHATALGAYTETPLAHSGKVAPDSNLAGLYSMDTWGWLDIEGSSTGLMGGAASPWSGATSVTYMGKYDVSLGIAVGPPYLWTSEINSYNVNNLTNTTYDGGAYRGFIGGVWKGDGTIAANVYSLYIDPSGNAGILKGSLAGAYYPALNMFAADGQWTPTAITTGLMPAQQLIISLPPGLGYNITSLGDFGGAGSIDVAGNEMLSATDWRYSINGQDWGVWKTIIGGDYYTGTPSDTWSLSTTVNLTSTIYGTKTDAASGQTAFLQVKLMAMARI